MRAGGRRAALRYNLAMSAGGPDLSLTDYGRLLGFMYQMLGDAALAVTATDQVWTLLGRGPASTDPVRRWRTALRVLNRYVRRGLVLQPLAPEGGLRVLLRALHQLPLTERALLLLRYHLQLDPATLAAVVALAPPELAAELQLARQHLLEVQRDDDPLF